ncbi:MAG: hypothetical protein KDB69_06645 [Acidimicrobiia bacterium]|nr:hypothetical protein [Acidimicrobiia bacterium]
MHDDGWTFDGSWRTYLVPGQLHDESPVSATLRRRGDDWVITYVGSIAADDVTGELVVHPDGSLDWADSWHTAGVIEYLTPTGDGRAAYQYGPDDERWTWSTEVEVSTDRLAVSHFNAPPGGAPALAVAMAFD